jgi:hypothetical protein
MKRAKSRPWTELSQVYRSRRVVAEHSLTTMSAMERRRYSPRWIMTGRNSMTMKNNLGIFLLCPILLIVSTLDEFRTASVLGASKNVWLEYPVNTRDSAKKVYRCGSGTEWFEAKTAWPEGGEWTWYGATLYDSATNCPSSAFHDFVAPEGPCTISAMYNGEISHAVIFTAVKFDHTTIATTPTNRARMTLGIAEEVDLTISPASPVTWYIYPPTGEGTLSSYSGSSTTFLASRSPSEPWIWANIGEEDADQATCVISFTVIAPTGITYSQDNGDTGGYPLTPGPPNDLIGNGRTFPITILPTTVSFYGARFRERVLFNIIEWPNGQIQYRPGSTPEFSVNFANASTDHVSESPAPYSRLFNGENYVDFSFATLIPLDYLNEENTWTEFVSSLHTYHQRLFQANGGCSIRVCSSTGAQQSDYRGPWRNE